MFAVPQVQGISDVSGASGITPAFQLHQPAAYWDVSSYALSSSSLTGDFLIEHILHCPFCRHHWLISSATRLGISGRHRTKSVYAGTAPEPRHKPRRLLTEVYIHCASNLRGLDIPRLLYIHGRTSTVQLLLLCEACKLPELCRPLE